MYRLGGLTAPQLADLIGISDPAASRTLKTLERSRLAEQNAVKAWWHPNSGRPRSFYYLSSRDSGRGVTYGAYLAGEENERRARASYKLAQLPARAAHASLRNEFYLLLRDDVGSFETEEGEEPLDVPVADLWSETHEDFPLLDSGTVLHARKNARTKFGRIYPDGYFTVDFSAARSCRYLLEVETQSRTRKLLAKLDGYGSHYHRRLREDGGAMPDWLSPVVFLFRTPSTAEHAREAVSEAIGDGSPALSRYLGFRDVASISRGLRIDRLVLFANLEELKEGGALGGGYRALEPYPEGRGGVSAERLRVDLEAAAEELERVLAPDDEEREKP